MGKTGPDLQSIKHTFARLIMRGVAVDTAASMAGINDDALITEYLAEIYSDDRLAGHHEIEAVTTAITTLKDLCGTAEEEATRCKAAQALLQYVTGSQRAKRDKQTGPSLQLSVQSPTLWDFGDSKK